MKTRQILIFLLLLLVVCSCDSGSKQGSAEQKTPAKNEPAPATPVAETPMIVVKEPAPITEEKEIPPAEQVQVQTQESSDQEKEGSPVTQAEEDIRLEAQDRDPMELVKTISETGVEELTRLSFLELNLLKNTTYAANGYHFAEDKTWLQMFFCGGIFSEGDNLEGWYTEEENAREERKRKLALQEWRSRIQSPTLFDLSQYAFPGCDENGVVSEQQKLAAANVRIAIIKKLEKFNGNLERSIDQIWIPEFNHVYYLLGKLFPSAEAGYVMDGEGYYEYDSYLNDWKMSLKRELMGLNQFIKLMNRLDDFDQMELLGLYAGDIALLKNIIEAKHGKPFQGVPGWEISQLIGMTDVDPAYDPAKLPVKVQVRIQILEETIRKILRSDLSDVPKELQEGTIHIENWYPAAC